MTILELLKGAKTFLSQTGKCDLPNNICFAVEDYVLSTNMHIYPELCWLEAVPAQNYIHHKLAILARKSQSPTDLYFTDECACYVLGIDACRVTPAMCQQARHRWLDSLIAELESAQSKTY